MIRRRDLMRQGIGAVLSAALAALAWAGAASAAGCRDDQVFLRGPFGSARFSVEIADTTRERARGLMFRESMAKSHGMLFIFDRPARVSFWMKNTLIPLDMLFVDKSGVVRKVHHMAQPGDLTSIHGGAGILAVLEINGGLSQAMGIVAGSELRHPAFGAEAAWPCE